MIIRDFGGRNNPTTPVNSGRLPLWAVIPALLAIPLLFWRPYYFFIVDDWTALQQMVENPFWQYLNHTDNEQWFPIFHLAYYLLIQISGDRYSILVFANCLGTGINAYLVYLFYCRHLTEGKAFILSLIFAGLVVHGATIYHAYNLCYLLAFGFFMGALLWADAYLAAPSGSSLAGTGVCALLALLSHSFAIMSLVVILLYGFLLRREAKGKFWPLALVMASVYLVFGAGYAVFAGISAASSNRPVLQLPGFSYLLYIFYGGLVYPVYFLVGGFSPFRTLVIQPIARLLGPAEYFKTAIIALLVYAAALPLILSKGNSREKGLAMWATLMNLPFFFLVGLARYHMDILQSGALRYGVFTVMGPLLLLGLAWQTLSQLRPQRRWLRILPGLMLAWIIAAQVESHQIARNEYLRLAQSTYKTYLKLDQPLPESSSLTPQDAGQQLFCPEQLPLLTRSQALAIKRFLRGLPQEK